MSCCGRAALAQRTPALPAPSGPSEVYGLPAQLALPVLLAASPHLLCRLRCPLRPRPPQPCPHPPLVPLLWGLRAPPPLQQAAWEAAPAPLTTRSHSQSPASPAAALTWDGGPVNQAVGEHRSKPGVWSRAGEQENGRGSAEAVLGPLYLTKISSVKGRVKQG